MNFYYIIIATIFLFSGFITVAYSESDVDSLLAKGNQASSIGDYRQAITYFEKVLEIEPNNAEAKKERLFAAGKLSYRSFNGFVEIIIRDQQGNLVGYSKNPTVSVIDLENYKEWVISWPTKEINYQGKKVEALTRTSTIPSNDDRVFSQFGLKLKSNLDVFTIFTLNNGFPMEKTDTITLIYSLFNKPE